MEMEKGTSCITVFSLVSILFFAFGIEAEARASSLEIDAKLKLLNKPAVKTIKSEDGEIIDCVDIYKQPAFDHPALKNHIIQMRPSFDYQLYRDSSTARDESGSVIFQTWQKSGSCPDGTIPIRRIRKEDLLRADSLEQFGKKPPAKLRKSSNTTNGPNLHFPKLNNTYGQVLNRAAAYLATADRDYFGAQAGINVWNPNVDLPDDITTAQIWVQNSYGQSLDSVETGWMVHPKLYGDKATRLFIYWTSGSYQSSGCFDLTCSGFVQTNKDITIGGTFNPVSTPSGDQYRYTVGIFWDKSSGNWWLKVSPNNVDAITVGYWPGGLFRYLSRSARKVVWGGEVYSSQIGTNPHTATAMGSGSYANALFGRACYMRNVRIVDYSYSLRYPESSNTYADEGNCYSALNYVENYSEEPMFYFGGPGRHLPYCP